MSAPATVLFVCTGNICRSPMAEGLFAHALPSSSQFAVKSAGTQAMLGAPASTHTLNILADAGIDLSGHQAQQLTDTLLEESVLILALAESHLRAMLMMRPDLAQRMFLVNDFSEGSQGSSIADPYGGSRADYEQVQDELVEAIPGILRYLETLSSFK